MLTKLLTKCGLTRDWAGWFWVKLVGAASLVSSGVLDVHYWSAYVGIPLSDVAVHRIIVVSGVVLWLGGQYSTSHLASKAELETVKLPTTLKEPV